MYKNFDQYGHHFKFKKNADGDFEEIYVMPSEEWGRYTRPAYTVKECAKDIGVITTIVVGALAVGYLLLSGLACAKWGIDHNENPFGLKGPFNK